MLRRTFSSLRTRLLALVLMATVPAFVAILSSGLERQRHDSREAADQALQMVRFAQRDYGGLIDSAHQLLTVLAQLPQVRASDPAACNAFMADLLKQYPRYTTFLVARPDGDVTCSAVPLSAPVHVTDRGYFQKVLQTRDFAVGSFIIGRVTGKTALPVAHPVLDASGQLQAVLVTAIDLTWLNQLAEQASLPAGSSFTMTDDNGVILARYPDSEEWVGQSRLDAPIAQLMLAQRSEGSAESVGVDGVRRLYAFTPLDSGQNHNIYIRIGIPSSVAYGAANRNLVRNLLWLGAVVMLTLLAVWLGGDVLLLRRVKILINTAQRIAAGDLNARTGHGYGEDELDLLARAFDGVADSWQQSERERRQAEAVLQKSEEKYRILTENLQELVYSADPNTFEPIHVNHSIEAIYGYSMPEWLADPTLWEKSIHPTDRERIIEEITQSKRCGQNTMIQYRVIARDGTIRWVEDHVSWKKDEGGRTVALNGILYDITGRKRAEEALRESEQHYRMLARIAARLNAQLDLDAVFQAVCEEIHSALNVQAAAVYLYNAQRDWLSIVADDGLPRTFRERHTPTPRARYDEFVRVMGPVNIIPDAQAVPNLPNADLYIENNIRTIASAGVLRQGQLIGALTVYTIGRVRQFNEAELELLEGIANQAAQAISNARLYEQAQSRLNRTEALHSIDMSITSTADLHITLAFILEQSTAQLNVDAADILLLNPHTQTLDYAAGHGFRTEALQYTRLRLGEGHAGRAALERRHIHIPDLRGRMTDFPRSPRFSDEGFVAYYVAPLIAKGEVKGVLEVFHRVPHEADEEWLAFLHTLASQAAIALDNARLFEDLQRANFDLMLAYDATIEGWSRALDLRDKETEGHTQRVTELTVKLARAMGMSEAEIVHVRRGALLHDIGKMGVPDHILFKRDKLTDEEWTLMRQHPQFAYDMLAPIDYLQPALDIPYCHHEKWAGTGYPRGLKGEQIPLAARIFAVVDVWDALRSDRFYRPGLPEEKVLEHIRSLAGTHFDPQAVELFLSAMNESREELQRIEES